MTVHTKKSNNKKQIYFSVYYLHCYFTFVATQHIRDRFQWHEIMSQTDVYLRHYSLPIHLWSERKSRRENRVTEGGQTPLTTAPRPPPRDYYAKCCQRERVRASAIYLRALYS